MARNRAKWPSSTTEKRDRDRVVDLVRVVGEQKLVWTVYDVRRAMKAAPRLVLTHSGQLSRHLHALDAALITPVDKRLNFGPGRDGNGPSKARQQWVLTGRLSEYEAGGISLDDLERVYHALWVAIEVAEVDAVATRDVTKVLQNIEALALVTPRNTANHLTTLHARPQRLVEKVKSGRWSLWRPLGERPTHPDFDRWVQRYREVTNGGQDAPRTGHATINAVVQELVSITVRLMRSPTAWPAGRSVQLADIRAAAGKDGRAAELATYLRTRGRSIGSVLGDLTKEHIAGRRRVVQQVVKVGAVNGSGPYYDVPAQEGIQRRRLIVPFRQLQAELAPHTIRQLDAEVRAAERFRRGGSASVLQAIGVERLMTIHRELDPAGLLLRELEESAHLLGRTVRDGVRDHRSRLTDILSRVPPREVLEDEAEELTRELGLELGEALKWDRPMMTPHEYVSYLSPVVVGKLTPSEFLHRVKTLRRFDNPGFVTQTDPDPARAARYCIDRAEGLCYLAERYQGRVHSFLRAGLHLLGRDFRGSALVRLLARSDRSADRRAALGALVLLDDPEAAAVAVAWLRCSERPEEVVDALQALLILGLIPELDWPDRIRRTDSRLIRDALTNVVLAARTGRRLLQR